MEHSKMYNDILTLYKRKFWKIDRVRDAVTTGHITPTEFEEITGIPYEED